VILIAMSINLPFIFSLDASVQVISVWGCIAAALYGLSRYTMYEEITDKTEKQRIFKNMLRFCAVLAIWGFILISVADTKPHTFHGNTYEYFRIYYVNAIITYREFITPDILSEFSSAEAVNITEQLMSSVQNYGIEISSQYTRIVSVVLKNETFSLQYDVEAWFHFSRSVPWISAWLYGKSFDDFKKELAKDSRNYNSPDLDSTYDGIGSVFFRRIFN